MQTIWDVFTFLRFVCNKPLGGYISAIDAGQALEAGQMAVFNKYWLAAYGSNQTGIEALTPFMQAPSVVTPSATGLATFPTNLVHILSVTRQKDNKICRLVLRNELQDALQSTLYPIADNPRYSQYAGGIQLYPGNNDKIVLEWLKAPLAPVIGITVDGSGNEVYNAGSSVQLQFDRTHYNEIISEALVWLGVSIANPEVMALSAQQQKA